MLLLLVLIVVVVSVVHEDSVAQSLNDEIGGFESGGAVLFHVKPTWVPRVLGDSRL